MINSLFMCLLYACLNVSGAAIIKWKLKNILLLDLKGWLNFLMDFHVFGASILIISSALVMFKALSGASFSFIIPTATGINFVLTILLGYYFFEDKLNFTSFIGFTLILSGVVILALNKS